MTTVKLGYFVNPECAPGAHLRDVVREQQETVRHCRDLGLSAVITGEHYSRGPHIWLPPLMLLSQLCEQGEGMTFGTGVLVAALHQPVRLAEQVAFLDQMTSGKFVLGLSAGWNRTEFAALGVPMAGRTQKLEEMVESLRLLWAADGPVSYSGTQFSFEDVELVLKPQNPGGVPIWIGASSELALRRAAALGDAWIASSHAPNEQVNEQARSYERLHTELARPTPATRPGLRNVYVAATREQALNDAGAYLQATYGAHEMHKHPKGRLAGTDGAVDHTKLTERAIIGDPDTVIEELTACLQASQVNLLFVRTQWVGMPDSLARNCLELLSQRVMPAVNAALV